MSRKFKGKTMSGRVFWITTGVIVLFGLYLSAQISLMLKWSRDLNVVPELISPSSNKPVQEQCFPTTSYIVDDVDYESGVVLLQSLYGSVEKRVGGDELYPTIVSASSTEQVLAVGRVTDLSNGQYAVRFKSLEEFGPDAVTERFYRIPFKAKGGISVKNILLFSCGEGYLPPPAKSFRTDNGAINQDTSIENLNTLASLPVEKYVPRSEPQIDLKKFDRVVVFGDSLMEQLFLGGNAMNINTQDSFWRYHKSEGPISLEVLLKFWIHPIQGLCKRNSCGEKTLLMLGSGLWDMLEECTNRFPSMLSPHSCDYDTDFDKYADDMFRLLYELRTLYPDITIGWKSMTATHVQQMDCNAPEQEFQKCSRRMKYMSLSRAERIYEVQKETLKEFFPDVLFADIYDLTYARAHQTRTGDGMHFRCEDSGVNVCKEMFKEVFGNTGQGLAKLEKPPEQKPS